MTFTVEGFDGTRNPRLIRVFMKTWKSDWIAFCLIIETGEAERKQELPAAVAFWCSVKLFMRLKIQSPITGIYRIPVM